MRGGIKKGVWTEWGNHTAQLVGDIRYKLLWIGKIAKHKDIGEAKVLWNLSFTEIPVSELKWAN